MKTKKIKYIFATLTICIIIGSICFGLSAFNEADTEESARISEVQAAIEGVFETQAQMGMFQSEDGLTTSLSQSEIDQLISDYNKKVDLYYSKNHYCNEYYKWLNEQLLTSTCKTVIDNCIDGGVLESKITDIEFNDTHTQATAEVELTAWNKWVTQDQERNCFIVSNPVNKDKAKVEMVLEDGSWKLSKTTSYLKGETGDDSETVAISSENTDQMSTADLETLQDTVERNRKILSAEYSSYAEAFNAAISMEVVS